MTYEEFIELRGQNKVVAGIDNSVALRLVDRLPKRYRAAVYFWSWIWMLSVRAGILVAIFYKWWVGLLVLLFVTPVLFTANKKSAAQFVLEHATENQDFFEPLTEKGLLALT